MRTAYQNIKGAAAAAWDLADFPAKKKKNKNKIKGEKGNTHMCIIHTYLNAIKESPHKRTQSENLCCPFLQTKTTGVAGKFR